MPMAALLTGIALILVGIVGFFATGMVSWTAWIPAFFGLPLALLGVAGRRAAWRKHAMHAAAGLALLGLLGSALGVPKVIRMIAGGAVERPGAAISQAVMAVVCLVFVALAVKSFIDARCQQTPDATPQA